MWWNNCWNGTIGWGFGGWFMGFLFLIIIIGVVLVIFLSSKNRGNFLDFSKEESPLDIIKKRYAKGEITKDDFEKMKKDLEN